MARGKDAPISTAGQINPQTFSLLQQDKQNAENRLVQSMQQGTEIAKQKDAQRHQMMQQGFQAGVAGAQQQQQLAARAEMQDKELALRERAQREDRQFRETMAQTRQAFESAEAEKEREYRRAVMEQEWEKANELYKQVEEARQFDRELEMQDKARTSNATLSLVKFIVQKESNKEKALTSLIRESRKAQAEAETRSLIQESTFDAVHRDPRMDRPVPGEVEATLSEIGPVAALGAKAFFSDKIKKVRENAADPIAVLQDEVSRNVDARISLNDLRPERTNNIVTSIISDKIQAADIASLNEVLLGGERAILEKVEEVRGSDNKAAREFWEEQLADVRSMKTELRRLRSSKMKIDDKETVGMRVRSGLAGGSTFGDQVREVLASVGEENWDAVFEELTKPLQVPALAPISEDLSPYAKSLREAHNNMIFQQFPDLRPADPNEVK